MFAEVKRMLTFIPEDETEYDAKIIGEIKACALDLTTSTEIVLPGEINITRTQDPQTGAWTITDASTITDDFVIKTIATWCDKEIGNPPNYDNLQRAYDSRKGQMRLSKTYNGSAVTTE